MQTKKVAETQQQSGDPDWLWKESGITEEQCKEHDWARERYVEGHWSLGPQPGEGTSRAELDLGWSATWGEIPKVKRETPDDGMGGDGGSVQDCDSCCLWKSKKVKEIPFSSS